MKTNAEYDRETVKSIKQSDGMKGGGCALDKAVPFTSGPMPSNRMGKAVKHLMKQHGR